MLQIGDDIMKTLIHRTLAMAGFLWGANGSPGAISMGTDFVAGEAIQSIAVKIGVGSSGESLAEPVALDLGLGFPLWLHPLGRTEKERALFGAIPARGGQARTIAAGQGATFTFDGGSDAGQDLLGASAQLLAGSRVSDISRIGFSGRGSNDWVLAEYEIKINGKTFAANSGLAAKARETQEKARARMAELDTQVAPAREEADELKALVEAGLANDQDRERMRVAEERLLPLLGERERLRRQLGGGHPWFIEPEFRSAWRSGDEIREMKVTLTTAAHSGADTRNYVYFRAGGHKYLVASPANPFGPDGGPRELPVDLMAGPLTASDLRGYAVGMIGVDEPADTVPDRWHPQRLIVEVDGRVVYDSEENDIDRMSLEAVRIIPPAHRDRTGKLVKNTPGPRETFVWEAGKGMGLDLANGGALSLPADGQPGYPEAEPGLEDASAFGGTVIIEDWGGFNGDYPPFPGEGGYWPGWGWGDGWGTGWGAGPGWMDVLLGALDSLAPLLPGLDPPPVGEPFQVTSVRMTSPADPSGNFAIQWDVTGDAGSIQDFTILILPVRPEQANAIDFAAPMAEIDGVGAGARNLSVPLSHYPAAADAPYLYLIPVVIAHATDAAADEGVGDHTGLGLALPYVFSATDPDQMHVSIIMDEAGAVLPISPGDPGGSGPAVWFEGELASHRTGLLFGNTMPEQNIVIRPGAGAAHDDIYVLTASPDISGRYRCHFNLGFRGGSDGANATDADMIAQLIGGGPTHRYYPGPAYVIPGPWPQPLTHMASTPGGDEPMPVIGVQEPPGTGHVVDTAVDGGPGLWQLRTAVHIRGAAVDADHPCVLFGLRLVKVP